MFMLTWLLRLLVVEPYKKQGIITKGKGCTIDLLFKLALFAFRHLKPFYYYKVALVYKLAHGG
jgi:hypothetical protein